MATAKTVKAQIDMLARLLEKANKASRNPNEGFGKCEWTDIEGNARCNSPWSEFQCEQAGGVFTEDARCDEE